MTDEKTPQTTYLKNYRTPDWLVDFVDITFDLYETHAFVHTRLNLRQNPVSKLAPVILFGEDLELMSLEFSGTPLPFKSDQYKITFSAPAKEFTLDIITRLKPQENTRLEGLYRSKGMFCTQCEAEGFRRITYYPDRPDVMARFRTTIQAEQARYPVLLSNGNRISSRTLPNKRHEVVWDDPFPKPSYLFALVAGNLYSTEDNYITSKNRKVQLSIYVEKDNLDKTFHAMASLKQAMRWDEERFGLEYDLDTYMIVAVNDFNMGAMENKGLNIFNSKYILASDKTATDQDYENIQGVIGHEYFHNWTGNRVTCRDWFQLSLKEGLTVFRDQEFTSDLNSRPVKRIQDIKLLRTAQFAEDAGPMSHPVRPESYIEISNFYTLTIYEKGAEIIRMLHTLLGEKTFQEGM
ncbi:MAG: aminopeptidase N, partial [Pseudomonadota bacterium]|nr:aminopeptidase N [Pseudomonadota bacterium]